MYGNQRYASVMIVAVSPYPGVCPPVSQVSGPFGARTLRHA